MILAAFIGVLRVELVHVLREPVLRLVARVVDAVWEEDVDREAGPLYLRSVEHLVC
jgi:hypothetical protein